MTFNNPTLITFTAPTCSGKSYLLNEMVARGDFSRIVSTTTRRQRAGETEGVDYYFIDNVTSRAMERAGEFFELITFNDTRYGVTHSEMRAKMTSGIPPIVVLEPQGLQIYEQKCHEHGWGIFKVYVHVVESARLERLLGRANEQVMTAFDSLRGAISNSTYGRSFHDVAIDRAKQEAQDAIREHQRRLKSVLGEERRWQNMSTWDAIVPGDNVEKAIEMIEHGIAWRNQKERPPAAIGRVPLPLV